MRKRLLFLVLAALPTAVFAAQGSLAPTPHDYGQSTGLKRQASTQKDAWVQLDLPLRQLPLFPGDGAALGTFFNIQRAAPSVQSTLQGHIRELLTPESRYLSYASKFQAMELVAESLAKLSPPERASALAAQFKQSLVLPPSLRATLEKYGADRNSLGSQWRQATQSVKTTWLNQTEGTPTGSPHIALWEQRSVPVESSSPSMAEALQAYVVDWYTGNQNREGYLLGLRPDANGFTGPAIPRPATEPRDAHRVLPSPLADLLYQQPTRLERGASIRAKHWPVTGVIQRAQQGRGALPWDELEKRTTEPEGLIVVLGGIRRRATRGSAPTLTYAGLRPLFWMQDEYRSQPIGNFFLLTSRLAGASNETSFYTLAHNLAHAAPMDPQTPAFFLLQALFPGSLTDAASLKDMLENPEDFAARHLAKVAMSEQAKEEPWEWEVEFSLFHYWH